MAEVVVLVNPERLEAVVADVAVAALPEMLIPHVPESYTLLCLQNV